MSTDVYVDAERDVFFLASHVMAIGFIGFIGFIVFIVSLGLATGGIIPKVNIRLSVHTQENYLSWLTRTVFSLDLLKNSSIESVEIRATAVAKFDYICADEVFGIRLLEVQGTSKRSV